MARSSRLKERGPQGLAAEILREAASCAEQTAQEENELVQRAKAGDQDAQERLVRANLGLVVRAVRRYVRLESARASDLFQQGYLGLRDAIRKFDPSRGNRLKEFAQYNVHWRIKRALTTERRQREMVGSSAEKTTPATDDSERDLRLWEHGEDIRRSGISDDHYTTVGDSIEAVQIDLCGGDVIPLPSPADLAEFKDVSRILAEVLSTLPSHEQHLLRRRYGFCGNEDTTLAAVSHDLGIRRSTLKKAEAAVLARLRGTLAGKGIGQKCSDSNHLERENG